MRRWAPALVVLVLFGCAGLVPTPTPAPTLRRAASIASAPTPSPPDVVGASRRVFGPTPGFETGRAGARYVSAVAIAAGPPQAWTAQNIIMVGVQGQFWDAYAGQFWAWDQHHGRTVTLVFPSGSPPRDVAHCFRVFGLVRPPVTASPGRLGYQVAIEVYEMELVGPMPLSPIEFRRVCAAPVDGPIAEFR